ncbi:MAG: hypothetical protein ROW39_12360 [Anaerolineaceae bacterium]|jgi:hypothetical protein
MPAKPLFAGLIVDENSAPVGVTYVGETPCYVVDDAGFRRHIPSEVVDRQILSWMKNQIEGHEDVLTEQTAKMLGQEDPFSFAMILNQLKQIDQQFEHLLNTGIPEEGRAYMGMLGFQVVINLHGDVIDVKQPGIIGGEEEDE